MKRVAPLLAVALVFTSCGRGSGGGPALRSFADSSSYAIGLNVGESLKRVDAMELDVDLIIRGLRDQLADAPGLNQQQAQLVLVTFERRMREGQAERQQALLDRNTAEGEAFLAENAKKEGVITTASGLQYEVLEEGDGPSPSATDEVRVHYRGRLLDGTEFDSSYEGGEPVAFRVNGVIPGWTEALQLMNVGSKYRLFVPPALAYGEQGTRGEIGPNATLIFEVELLGM